MLTANVARRLTATILVAVNRRKRFSIPQREKALRTWKEHLFKTLLLIVFKFLKIYEIEFYSQMKSGLEHCLF